jgi:putative Mg2+ transporter-C (MgtC) family protein
MTIGITQPALNTAATLWCSAAVGVLAGGGALSYAALAAGMAARWRVEPSIE